MIQLPPWSYSMLEAFEQCPRKAYHRYILKEKPPETEEQRKGNLFDKVVETRLRDGVSLPEEYAQYEPFAASLANMKGPCSLYTQLKMGIRKDFTPCGFFDKDVWGRGVLDVALVSKETREGIARTALITDWKTGKNSEGKSYSNNGLQLKIFGLLLFKHFPRITDVTAFNLWLKSNEIGKPWKWSRSDQEPLWREVLPKIMAMEAAYEKMRWPEMPGPLCGWCAVKACQFNKS